MDDSSYYSRVGTFERMEMHSQLRARYLLRLSMWFHRLEGKALATTCFTLTVMSYKTILDKIGRKWLLGIVQFGTGTFSQRHRHQADSRGLDLLVIAQFHILFASRWPASMSLDLGFPAASKI